MNCHDHELVLLDLARGVDGDGAEWRAALDHAAHCPRCAAVLHDQRELSRGLRALASSLDATRNVSLEARLLARIGSEPAVAVQPVWRGLLKVAAAAILVAGALVAAWRDVSQLPPPSPPAAGFVLWPGAAALPPFESGELVRTELPVAVLPTLGLPTPPTTGETVTADLLVAQDGLVRAVRLAN